MYVYVYYILYRISNNKSLRRCRSLAGRIPTMHTSVTFWLKPKLQLYAGHMRRSRAAGVTKGMRDAFWQGSPLGRKKAPRAAKAVVRV